jgi:hypothetical protein
MGPLRSRLALVAVVLSLAVAAGASTMPAMAQTSVRPSEPRTRWDLGFGAPFRPANGLSTWLATFADPAAGPGQSEPNYSYFLDFSLNLVSSFQISWGSISLDVVGRQKFATLTITESPLDGSRAHRVQVPFAWKGNSFYFLWVNRLADGLFGGWVYDVTEATWTYIGAVLVPTHLTHVDSTPQTGVEWTGPNLETCDAYPEAVVVFRAPVAYYDSPTQSIADDRGVPFPGDCPATAGPFAPLWDYYVVGTPAG